jgi:predicted small lipoprotein YifL
MKIIMRLIAAAILLSGALAGCGLKGDLYLEDTAQDTAEETSQAVDAEALPVP